MSLILQVVPTKGLEKAGWLDIQAGKKFVASGEDADMLALMTKMTNAALFLATGDPMEVADRLLRHALRVAERRLGIKQAWLNRLDMLAGLGKDITPKCLTQAFELTHAQAQDVITYWEAREWVK